MIWFVPISSVCDLGVMKIGEERESVKYGFEKDRTKLIRGVGLRIGTTTNEVNHDGDINDEEK